MHDALTGHTGGGVGRGFELRVARKPAGRLEMPKAVGGPDGGAEGLKLGGSLVVACKLRRQRGDWGLIP